MCSHAQFLNLKFVTDVSFLYRIMINIIARHVFLLLFCEGRRSGTVEGSLRNELLKAKRRGSCCVCHSSATTHAGTPVLRCLIMNNTDAVLYCHANIIALAFVFPLPFRRAR